MANFRGLAVNVGITKFLNLHREKSFLLLSTACLCFILIIHSVFSFYDVKVWNHFRTHKNVVGSRIQIYKLGMSQKVFFFCFEVKAFSGSYDFLITIIQAYTWTWEMQDFRPYQLSLFFLNLGMSVQHAQAYAENKGMGAIIWKLEIQLWDTNNRKINVLSDLEILAEFHYLWLTQTPKWLD